MITTNRYFLMIVGLPVALALICLIVISFVVSSSDKHIYKSVDAVPEADAALILGAGILRNGELSPVLKDRADQAIELYQAAKVKKIIASGDSQTQSFNEVQPIRNYLVKKGIPEEDIFLDYAGFDTYSSIYRARDIFLVTSLSIVTQSFHLPRAVFIARNLGIEANGVSADRGHYKLFNYFREMAADIKAFINLITHRKPEYLGEEVPITGDGRASQSKQKTVIPMW